MGAYWHLAAALAVIFLELIEATMTVFYSAICYLDYLFVVENWSQNIGHWMVDEVVELLTLCECFILFKSSRRMRYGKRIFLILGQKLKGQVVQGVKLFKHFKSLPPSVVFWGLKTYFGNTKHLFIIPFYVNFMTGSTTWAL